MDGRISRKVCVGLLAVAAGAVAGCNTTRSNKAPEPSPVAAAPERGSMVSQFFGKPNPNARPNTDGPELASREAAARGNTKENRANSEVAMAIASTDAAYMKATAVERDQMLDQARQRYLSALKSDPQNRGALVGLGRFYAATGDKANAVAMLRAAIQYSPNDPKLHELHHRLAAIHFQFGDAAEAERETQLALRGDPGNRTYLKTLAVCQGHLNQWDAAFGTLVTSKVMSESEARNFLGRVLIDLGRVEEGKEQMQTAVTLDPANQQAKQFLSDLSTGGPPVSPQEPVYQVGHEQTEPPQIQVR